MDSGHNPPEIFSEEALKAQDGKTVPLTKYPGGPVIGEATLRYSSVTKRLEIASTRITDEKMADLLKGLPPSIKKES